MSWIEKLENIKFSITTGDGKTYFPDWISGEKSKEYNVSAYDFIKVKGTFVDRKQAKGSKYPLVFWFQGEDNIDKCKEFEDSADDSRPWTVKHPFYGTIKGQPLSLARKDNKYNATEVIVEFWESISKDYPDGTDSLDDVVSAGARNLNTEAATSFDSKAKPSSADQRLMLDSVPQISTSFKSLFNEDNFNDYQQKVSVAENSTSKLTSNSLSAITSVQSVISSPALFSSVVTQRINAYLAVYAKAKNILQSSKTNTSKIMFETYGIAIIAAIAETTVNPTEEDYKTRVEIEEITNIILSTYEDYLLTINNEQTDNSIKGENYRPAPTQQFKLHELVFQTAGNLFNLAFSAKQQRIIETDAESNLIILTHRYVGLDADDKNINDFRKLNNIKNESLFSIPKGKQIKYFV